MTQGKSGAKAPDRNRGRERPWRPRRRATYEEQPTKSDPGKATDSAYKNHPNARQKNQVFTDRCRLILIMIPKAIPMVNKAVPP
ncbi:hypothetical protein D9M72_205770 [compost metagenome]